MMNDETADFPARDSSSSAAAGARRQAGARRDVIDPATGGSSPRSWRPTPPTSTRPCATPARPSSSGPWPRTPARDRARILRRAADLIRERADELVAIESHDVGKPVTLCRAVDVETAAQQYEYCAALAEGLEGATRSTPIPALAYTLREPVGVVAAITPFNFPLILSSTKIAAALAAGNIVVHKPADDTPLSALFMAQLLSDAGVPDGVLNVVTGSGQVVGEALLRHPGVDKIAFTGSTAVGRHAASVAGEHLKPVTMELGGNAAHIVFDDADLDVAIGAVIKALRLQLRPVLHGRPAAAGRPPPARHRRGHPRAGRADRADRRPARRGDRHRPDGRRAAAAQGRGVRRARPQGGRPDRLRR